MPVCLPPCPLPGAGSEMPEAGAAVAPPLPAEGRAGGSCDRMRGEAPSRSAGDFLGPGQLSGRCAYADTLSYIGGAGLQPPHIPLGSSGWRRLPPST